MVKKLTLKDMDHLRFLCADLAAEIAVVRLKVIQQMVEDRPFHKAIVAHAKKARRKK